jgi:hypothetical protein
MSQCRASVPIDGQQYPSSLAKSASTTSNNRCPEGRPRTFRNTDDISRTLIAELAIHIELEIG